MTAFDGVIVVAAAAAGALVASLLRRAEPSSAAALEGISRTLAQLQAELVRLAREQGELRHDVQRGREQSVLQLSQASQGLRSELGEARRALAEVKAIEEGRARQLEGAAQSLRRLEAVVAGSSTRGPAGERIVARSLAQLPPDLLERNVAFGGKVVEYALRLPGGRCLPIDSKWTGAASLERLEEVEDPLQRRRLLEQVARDLRARLREATKYLDPEKTLGLALLAVPDAVHGAAPEVLGEAYREGVLVVPYSLLLPYALALYRLAVRFAGSVDADQLAARVDALEEDLRRIEEEVEGRLSRGLAQLGNARDALREHAGSALRTTQKLERAVGLTPLVGPG